MPNRYTEAHKDTKGPGDARPTGLQIIEDENLVGAMKDKVSFKTVLSILADQQTFLITGCSSGIGVETARALAATGARLFLGVRDLAKGEAACKAFLEPGRVELLEIDTSSLASVRKCAETFLQRSQKLNVLICNAGIMANPTRELSPDGFELQFATNYLGHFLLFWLLRETMLKSSTPEFNSRLVNVSSSGHHAGQVQFEDINFDGEGAYTPFGAYGQSKLAQIYMSNVVDRKYGPQGLHSTSLMPGGIATGLQIHFSKERIEALSKDPNIIRVIKSQEQGAATTILAAVAKEWEGRGGRYLDNCDEAGPATPEGGSYGYKDYAYDEAKEQRLWEKTLEILDLKDDEQKL